MPPIDKKLATHVAEWWSRAQIIDGCLDRFTAEEKDAYDYIRHIFDSPDGPDMQRIEDDKMTLGEVARECPDDFGAALKTFTQKVRYITSDFEAFRVALDAERNRDAGAEVMTRVIGGNTWTGTFQNGNPAGRGKIEFGDGSIYEGEWSSDGPHGQGVMTWPDGRKWAATFSNGQPVRGKITYPDGRYYEGEMNRSGAHGNGKLHTHDFIATGRFADDTMKGSGTVEWFNGNSYSGSWGFEKNMFTGTGTFIYADGTREKGSYVNGEWISDTRPPQPGQTGKKKRPSQPELICVRNIVAWALSSVLVAIIYVALFEPELKWWTAAVAIVASMITNPIANDKVAETLRLLQPAWICSLFTIACGAVYIYMAIAGDRLWYWAIGGALWILAGLVTMAFSGPRNIFETDITD